MLHDLLRRLAGTFCARRVGSDDSANAARRSPLKPTIFGHFRCPTFEMDGMNRNCGMVVGECGWLIVGVFGHGGCEEKRVVEALVMGRSELL